MQLMIVDDEAHVVERLTATIPWTEIGIHQVYKAFSGEEALEIIHRMSVDIVITDIHMPGMSGIDLIRHISEKHKKTKCILLSGYSDFIYAKEAIVHQTEDYLLKPVRDEDLLATVQRVIGKIKAEWEELISKQRMIHAFKEHLPLLRGKFLNDLLQGRKFEPLVLQEKMRTLELPAFLDSPFALLLIRLEDRFLEYDDYSLSLMEYAVGNMAEELYAAEFELWHAKDPHDYLIFLVKPIHSHMDDPRQSDEQLRVSFERYALHLQASVMSVLKGKVSVLTSGWGQFPDEVSFNYNSALTAFRKRIGREEGMFIRLTQDLLELKVTSLNALYEPPLLNHLLEAGRWEDAKGKLEQIFGELKEKHLDSQEHLLEVYFSITGTLASIAHKNGKQLRDLIGEDYDKVLQAKPFRSLTQMEEWAFRSIGKIQADMENETKDSRVSVIHQIQSFVEMNLSHDVSLQAIADHVHMHPVYVSKIYKLEKGENLSDYVSRVRMEKAAYLLAHTVAKIYEIAAQVGYQRPHSFNYAFKRLFGLTPQEYRDLHSTKLTGV